MLEHEYPNIWAIVKVSKSECENAKTRVIIAGNGNMITFQPAPEGGWRM